MASAIPPRRRPREVTAFLTALAVRDRVAASTQNHALNALLFLYREILRVELPWLDDMVRAKRPQHLPTVLTRDEVRAVLERLDGVPRVMALLLYGAGLRLLECCRLRINGEHARRGAAMVECVAKTSELVSWPPSRGDVHNPTEFCGGAVSPLTTQCSGRLRAPLTASVIRTRRR